MTIAFLAGLRDSAPSFRARFLFALAVATGALGGIAACTPEIGDKCVLSTDCSTRGDRLCDTSQPDGYCTQFNCSKNSCPDEAACVLFNAGIPGCGYNDRAGGYGSRVARAFCVARCANDEDCRGGYICRNPSTPPFGGFIQDDDQNVLTCLVIPPDYFTEAGTQTFTPGPPKPICGPVAPDVPPVPSKPPSLAPDSGTVVPPLVPDAGVVDSGDAGDAGDGGD